MFGKPKWAKIGLLGFAGSGKTYTAIDVAAYIAAKIGYDRPLRCFDSEGGIDYQLERITKLFGSAPDGVQSQSFCDLVSFCRSCKPGDVVLIDSITHPWRELLSACERANGGRGLPAIMKAKEEWGENFNRWFVGGAQHVIMCGRAGYEFDYEEIDGKKQLVKTNTKMKTEGELGFEPSLLIEMERRDRPDDTVEHVAIVKKDRFGVIDGRIYPNPTGQSFSGHIDRLSIGKSGDCPPALDTSSKTEVNGNGNTEFAAMMRERQIILEEIQDDLVTAWPSTSGEHKRKKIESLRAAFGTSSWTAIEKQFRQFPVEVLRGGREAILKLVNSEKEEEIVNAV